MRTVPALSARRVAAMAAVVFSLPGLVARPSSQGGGDAIRARITAGAYVDALTAAGHEWSEASKEERRDPARAVRSALLLVEALVRNGRGSEDAPLALARRAVALSEQGGLDALLPESLDALGGLLTERGDVRSALGLHQRALRLEESAGAQPDRLAESLQHVAYALIRMERFPAAEPMVVRALALRGPAPSLARARTLEVAALLYRESGQFPKGRAMLDEALDIRRRFSPGHPENAFGLELDGDLHWLMGDQPGAKAAWLGTLDLLSRTVGPAHPANQRPLRWLALAAQADGRMREAQSLMTRSSELAAATLPPCHREAVAVANDSAMLAMDDGRYSDAELLFSRAASVSARCGFSQSDAAATRLYNEGLLAAGVGDLPRSDRLLTAATGMWRRQLGRDHPFVARGVDTLAQVHADFGDDFRAEVLYRQALASRQRSLGPSHPDVARTVLNLAEVTARRGDVTHGLADLERAAAMVAAAGHGDSADLPARIASARGAMLTQQSRITEAVASYQRGLDLRVEVNGEHHPAVAAARLDLSRTQLLAGDEAAAFGMALRADEDGRDHLQRTARYLSERQALMYAAVRPRGLDLALSLVRPGRSAEGTAAFDAMARSRGMLLDEMAARAANGLAVAVDDRSSARLARERWATLLWRSVEGDTSVTRAALNQALEESEDAERALARIGAASRADSALPGTPRLLAALEPGDALISYGKFERWAAEPRERTGLRAVSAYVAFVLTRGDTDVQVVPLGPAAPIEAAIARWRTDVSARPHLAVGAGARVRRLVWDPVAAVIGDASMAFIVPDGSISTVSLAALPTTGGRYLLETGPTIHYLSTERDFLLPAAGPAPGGLLAVGGAYFDGGQFTPRVTVQARSFRTACAGAQRLAFGYLPGTAREISDLLRMWTAAGAGPATALRGSAATEPAVKAAVSGQRVVHFATHGFVVGHGCSEPTQPGSRSVGGLAAAPALDRARVESPLLLSGLALAGANARRQTGVNDGILTAEEVIGLNLQGTEWAVLSACDTGLGEIRAGEGVFGLRRAFQIAGARTVIMSLWSVDDQATRQWMHALYKGRLEDKLSTADAVRNASLTVLRDRRARGLSTHPFYWGAFVAAGDWR